MPIKVLFNKLVAFNPSEIPLEKQEKLEDYQWPLENLKGNEMNLKSSEGKVVLINLWATWCPPCVAEMPALQNLYDAYGDRVDFYFVSAENPNKLRKFMDKKGYDLPVYLYEYKAPDLLESSSLPTTFILSKRGNIVVNKTGSARWDSDKVKELLDALLAE
ncbi:TlpA family protein disulfide reductase [Aureisphaera galaxeae]|uniref:TlpA family protein disulfide reductase n=1 Tax=Aureisphaera galaxeae TaxID=1538023 RepID=UPI00234FFB0A|nr:TlpA disulfide reductase family protein [Aureisphaera galaxeae]